MATDWDEQQRQQRELEEIRRSFAEMGARMGSLFEPAELDEDEEAPHLTHDEAQAPQRLSRRPPAPSRRRAGSTPDSRHKAREDRKQASSRKSTSSRPSVRRRERRNLNSVRRFLAEMGRRLGSLFERAHYESEDSRPEHFRSDKAYALGRPSRPRFPATSRRSRSKSPITADKASATIAQHSRSSIRTEQPWFLTDEPIREKSNDEFHHQDVAEQLLQIVQADSPPDVVGIIGPFGTGKSSVSELLLRCFEGNRQRSAVRLSADKHTGVERQRALVYGLADALVDNRLLDQRRRDRLLRPLAASTQQATLDLAVLLLMVAVASATLALGYLIGSFIASFLAPPASNPWTWPTTKPWSTFALPAVALGFLLGFLKLTVTVSRLEAADEIERVFRALIAGCRKDLERLVVIVDDIDRLPPNQVLEAVTTIRSFKYEQRRRWEQGSECPRVVFIIACDETVLRQALADADPPISSLGGSKELAAAEYFEKLFAVRLYMPPHLLTSMRAYARKRLEDVDKYSQEATLQAIPILIHPGVKTPRHVIRLINAFVADFRLAFAREQQSERMAKDEVTKHPTVLSRLTVLRIDFPTTYRNIAEDPALLPALDAYIEDPLSMHETAREKVLGFFQATPTPETDKPQATHSTLEPSETEAYIIPPRHCRTVIEFLRATSDAATSRSLEPFFYLGQAPNAVILGGTVFGGIRDALLKGNASELGNLLSTLRGEPKSIQAAFNTIIEEVNSLTDIKTLSTFVRVCTEVLAQPSLTPIEECQLLVQVLVSRVAERPQIEVAPDALAQLIALSSPSRVRTSLMDRLADFNEDYESSTKRALAVYTLALLGRPEHYNFRHTLLRYFHTLTGTLTPDPSVLKQVVSENRHAGLASIAEDWLRMTYETDQLTCDEILGEDLYLFILELVLREGDRGQRLRPAIGLSDLVQLSERARQSRRLREMAWLCLSSDDAAVRLCAVRSLGHMKLAPDEGNNVIEFLLPVMNSDATYPETVLNITDLLIEWSSSIATTHDGEDGEALREWANRMTDVAIDRRNQLTSSLTPDHEGDNSELQPESVIWALLQIQSGDEGGIESLEGILEQLPSIQLSPDSALRALTICSQLITRNAELEESAYESIYAVISYLLRSSAPPAEARRLIRVWWILLHSGEYESSRKRIIAGLNRVAGSTSEDVEDLMTAMADELCQKLPVSHHRRGSYVATSNHIRADAYGSVLQELASTAWPRKIDAKVLGLLEERWEELDSTARSIVVEGIVGSRRSVGDLANELRQDMIEHTVAVELPEVHNGGSVVASQELEGALESRSLTRVCNAVRFLWPYMANHYRASLMVLYYGSLECLGDMAANASDSELEIYLHHASQSGEFDDIVLFLRDGLSNDPTASGRLREAAARMAARFLNENLPYGAAEVHSVVEHLFTPDVARRIYEVVAEFLQRTKRNAHPVNTMDVPVTARGSNEDGIVIAQTRAMEVLGALAEHYSELAPVHLCEAADGILQLPEELISSSAAIRKNIGGQADV